jgi:predicted PurR-regulated permease PerM
VRFPLQPVLTPIAVAAILAFLLEPVVKFSMRLGLSRIVGIALVYIAFAAFFAGLLVYIIPPAYRQGNTLVQNFPDTCRRPRRWRHELLKTSTASRPSTS